MTATEQRSEPTGGWIDDSAHFLPIRVYYEDTDFSGLVYHASYLRFMERGRSEFLRLCGVGHRGLLEAQDPLFWTVRTMAVHFVRPARVEDALIVSSRIAAVTGARMHLNQAIARDGEVLTTAEVEVCLIGPAGRPRRIPDLIRKRLEFYTTGQTHHARGE